MLNTADEISLGSSFFREVWGGQDDVVPADIAIASGHAGGYFSAAFGSRNEIVAASYGFVGTYRGHRTLHSHVTASRVSGVGFAIKQHQKQWASSRGFDAITWTFDPLVRRNCVFNLDKIGAATTEYLINFYGEMNDEINRGDDSDRLFAFWELSASTKVASLPNSATDSVRNSTRDVLEVPDYASVASWQARRSTAISDSNDRPSVNPDWPKFVDDKHSFAVYLPADIEKLRLNDDSTSSIWRMAVRDVLNLSFEQGARVRHMVDNRSALLVEWHQNGEQ